MTKVSYKSQKWPGFSELIFAMFFFFWFVHFCFYCSCHAKGVLISLIMQIIFYNIPGKPENLAVLMMGTPQRLTGWWHQHGVPGLAVRRVARVYLAGGSSSTSQLGSPRWWGQGPSRFLGNLPSFASPAQCSP